MTRNEMAVILEILSTAYPRFYSGPDAPDRESVLNLWTEMFADDDVALVAAAVKSMIAMDQRGFPPHIGAVKNAMHSLVRTGALDSHEAWELVRRAASRSGYGAQEEYERLPEEVRRLCSPGQLYEWSQMDSDVFNSVVSSNFQRAWRTRQESQRRDALLPEDVKKLLISVSGPLALEEGGTA